MTIIRSIRAELNLRDRVLDCYELPSGEKRIGIAGTSIAIGRNKNYLGRLLNSEKEDRGKLKRLGFDGTVIEVEVLLERGVTRVKTISVSDLDVLLLFNDLQAKKTKKGLEKEIQNLLAIKHNGITEVPTPAGIIDVLTSTEVIEIKEIKGWKSAVGQVLIYGNYYPSHQKRIHLFGATHNDYLDIIKKHCKELNILVTTE